MSRAKINPGFWAVIPAPVLYDNDLPPMAKLVYAEVSALANQGGFCWASNRHFAGRFDISPKRVSELISMLETRNYLIIEQHPELGNVRHIYLGIAKNVGGIPKNKDTYPEKCEEGIPKNVKHNNTFNNTSNNTSAPEGTAERATEVRKVYQLYLKQFKLDKTLDLPQTELLARAEKRYKLTDRRRQAIQRRLNDAGFNMLCAAIVGFSNESWYQGENNSGWTADLEKFICRSYEKVEEGANKYEAQKRGKNSTDPWANL